jgi:hypothetical protein
LAILVDQPLWWFRGRRWSHLVSDRDYDELHSFARALGVPPRAFHGDHYDLPEDHYQRALDAGAESVDTRVLLRRLRAAGLRRTPQQRRDAETPTGD